MFREMRRTDKAKDRSEAIAILEQCTNGILSVIGDEGYPYGVPVSYVYSEGKIAFHCATQGHKLDAIKANSKVSFTVVGADNIDPGAFTTNYKSVICFGKARIVEDDDRKHEIHKVLIEKYSKGFEDAGEKYMHSAWNDMVYVDIEIEHMTAKGLAK